MIIDTDVLIWYLKGNKNAKKAIDCALPFSISAISLMELMQGARNKAEQQDIRRQLRLWNVNTLNIDEAITRRAMQFVNDYSLSHSMGITDALIAGTAIEADESLLTGNAKHFEFIPLLTLNRFKP